MFTSAILAFAPMALAGPQQPFSDGAYWVPDWTGSIATVTSGGYRYAVSTADLTYQGAEATPTIRPKVGQRFYVRIRTSKTNYQDYAAYRMRVLLPAGVDADITSAQDVVCGLTDAGGNLVPVLPGECQDPVKVGYYWQFADMTLHSGETGWYWFPVKATQAQAGTTMQLLSEQRTRAIGAAPDPMVGSVPLRVDAAAVTVPSPPLSPWTVAGNASATISWSAPSSTGGSTITSYTATARAVGAMVGSSCSPAPVSSRSCTIIGLANDTAYTVTVVAANAVGTSAASASTTVTPKATATGPATVPGQPTGLRSDSGYGTETISWSAPASDGGSAILGYTARAYTAASGGALVGSCVTTTLSCTILDTDSPSTLYYVEAVARNGVGTGPPSSPRVGAIRAVPAGTPACSPVALAATPGNGTAAVSWRRPVVLSGSCTTGETQYQVRALDPLGIYAGGCVTSSTYPTYPPMACTVGGLANGVQYTVDIRAFNFLGWGQPSNALTVQPVPVAPGAPALSMVPGDGSAVAAWSVSDDGGSPVTAVVASAYADATGGAALASCTAAGSSCAITGLANGAQYWVDARATNAVGTGPASSPRVAVRPAASSTAAAGGQAADAASRALPPQRVTAVAKGGALIVGWRPPPRAAALTGYLVRAWSRSRGGTVVARCISPPTRRTCTLRGIPPGKRVYVDVAARTARGLGLPSSPRRAIIRR